MNSGGLTTSANPQRRRTVQIASGVALAVTALVVAALGFWQLLELNVTWQLDEARKQLQAGLDDLPESRLMHAQKAEEALRASGNDLANSSTRDLFLAAALSMQQQAQGVDYSIQLVEQVERLSLAVEPKQCSANDLYLAAKIFNDTDRPKQADWLIGHTLKRELEPNQRAEVLSLAAQVNYELGNEGAALHYAQQLIKQLPESADGWRVVASVHEASGQTESLVDAYRRLLEIGSEDEANLRLKLAERLVELGQTSQARKQIDWLRQNAPADLDRQPALVAEMHLLEGDAQQAAELADAILASDPSNEKAALLKGRILLAEQRTADAAALLRAYVRRDPFSSQAHYLLGQALARSGEEQEAKRHLDAHQRLLNAGVRLHKLRREVSANPHDSGLQREMVQLQRELGLE